MKRLLEREREFKIIRVFNQGELSTQRRAFETARDNIKLKYSNEFEIIFETRNITEVVNLGVTEDEQIAWLTEKDGLAMIGHPFQGDFPPDWDYGYFLKQLRKVAEATGIRMYPNPREVENDPTFSQDKFDYIDRCEDICIPSMKIMLNERKPNGSLTREQKRAIINFAGKNIEIRSKFYGGWVVKAPFSTDSKEITFCDSIEEIFGAIRILSNKRGNLRVPYLIIQPRLANRKEYKVCILSNPYTGEERKPFLCTHPHQIHQDDGYAFIDKYDRAKLFEFAKHAKAAYEKNIGPLTYPLFRVDIMRLQNGKMVVNEFESLEAQVYSATLGQSKRAAEDALTQQFLEEFWELELDKILNIHHRNIKNKILH